MQYFGQNLLYFTYQQFVSILLHFERLTLNYGYTSVFLIEVVLKSANALGISIVSRLIIAVEVSAA